MAIKHFCDRCGSEIPEGNLRTYIRPVDQDHDPALHGLKKEYELCLGCKHSLEHWLEAALGEERGENGKDL